MLMQYNRLNSIYLQKATGRKRLRVHWYPSGDFALLPLHAAGIYEGKDKVCAADFIVSSYTPSLSSLIRSRESFKPLPRHELRCLISGESAASGLNPIPEVAKEVNIVTALMMSVSATVVNDPLAPPKVDTVLEQVSTAHVLHLACHGHQAPDPLNSRFALSDGPLAISAFMKLHLPNAMLAFLSACETAKGDKDQPDQVVHLAASMLFCGFRSVIATMW
jgi:CHAT domain-containing protein